jgi:hypothetical protein
MSVNGKAKGNNFERKIANTLSERFESYLGKKNSFRRNPDSGSFFGGTNSIRTESYNLDYAVFGDLICPRNFTYSVECKHYKSPPSFQSIIIHKVSQWDTWLEQAERDATSSKRNFSLIIKYNNVDEIVFLKHKIPNVQHNKYKNYNIYLMKDWLLLPDENFFNNTQIL